MRNFCSLCSVYNDNDSYTEIDEPACISVLISIWTIHFLNKQDVYKEENVLVSKTYFSKAHFLTDFIVLVH